MVSVKVTVLWDVTPCNLVGGTNVSGKPVVHTRQITRRHIGEDSILEHGRYQRDNRLDT
jgi:hypothetical protein